VSRLRDPQCHFHTRYFHNSRGVHGTHLRGQPSRGAELHGARFFNAVPGCRGGPTATLLMRSGFIIGEFFGLAARQNAITPSSAVTR
jgi:hypothetical protein